MDSFTRFLARLKELIKGKIKDADLTAAEFDEAVRSARGHVGGTIRWEKARDNAAEGSQMNEWKLLSELALAEDKKTAKIQIFPKVQKYSHPRYGELDVSGDFLKEVKANFDQRIYQQDLPLTIDLEHESKLSGAAGWIKDVTIDDKNGMFATIEFNDRGQSLVADGGFKYFSPEFYDTWIDPATNKEYSNVLIGGALTNRPFFKGMAPVAMMREDSLLFVESAEKGTDDMDMAGMMKDMMAKMEAMMGMMGKGKMPDDEMMAEVGDMMGKMKKKMPNGNPSAEGQGKIAAAKDKAKAECKEATQIDRSALLASLTEAGMSEVEASAYLVELGLADKSNGGETMGMTEEEARQFKELSDNQKALNERLAAAETKAASEEIARKAAETAAIQAAERVQALERAATRKQLSEHVRANRLAYQGEVDEAVDRLEKLSDKLGGDFGDYLAEKEATHAVLKESAVFSQIGSGHASTGSGPQAEIEAAKRKVLSEHPGMTEVDALTKVLSENPRLYKAYDDGRKQAIKRGE